MAQANLSASVKTRITADAKMKIAAIATKRELGPADVVREAIREYLDRRTPASKAQR